MFRGLKANLAIAAAAVALWTLMIPVTGRIAVHDGLGYDHQEFAGMVRGYTLKGGDETTRLSPLFPALAWTPFALTGDVVARPGYFSTSPFKAAT